MFVVTSIALLALSPTALGIAFPGPAPTAAGEFNLNGRSPKPTGGPLSLPELFRRQQKDDGMCGYLEGDSEAPVSCSVGTCLYDDTISWFGCCTGSRRSDCELFTTCVGSASISSCLSNSACANDDYALACTASSAGVCMTMWGEVDEGSVSHFVCGPTSTKVQVVGTATIGTASVSSTARSTSAGGLPRSSSSVEEEDESSSTTRTSRAGTSSTSTDDRPRINTAVTATTRAAATTQSTAGAMKTAQAVLGAAGGLAGVVALLM